MRHRKLAVVLVLVLLLTMAVPVSAALNKDVRDSVVMIWTQFNFENSGILQFGWGSGFFINDQYIVTNHHVIKQFINLGLGEKVVLNEFPDMPGRATIRVYFESDDYEEAYLVGYDEVRDLAVLRLDKPTNKRTPLDLRVPTEDMFSAEVYAVGYPGLSESTDAAQKWGRDDASSTSGGISRLFTESGTGVQMIQLDFDVKQGNSGGPVVDANGDVVGVVSSFRFNEYAQTFGYAVNSQELILLLNKLGISYTMASDETASDETGTQAGVIYEEPEENDNLVILLVAIAAAVIITGLVVVLILTKKKSAKPVSPVIPVTPVMRPVVRSYSKANYGATVTVGQQPILIGRGGNCTLRFPNNAPGVSGSHCTIQWDAATRDFIVTDLNSTYGTFLMSGQKMQPHQPYRMRAGDKFYLAEQSNTIGLSME